MSKKNILETFNTHSVTWSENDFTVKQIKPAKGESLSETQVATLFWTSKVLASRFIRACYAFSPLQNDLDDSYFILNQIAIVNPESETFGKFMSRELANFNKANGSTVTMVDGFFDDFPVRALNRWLKWFRNQVHSSLEEITLDGDCETLGQVAEKLANALTGHFVTASKSVQVWSKLVADSAGTRASSEVVWSDRQNEIMTEFESWLNLALETLGELNPANEREFSATDSKLMSECQKKLNVTRVAHFPKLREVKKDENSPTAEPKSETDQDDDSDAE